jgi:hypothetical protein
MPNFCFNEITITGKIENVRNLMDKIDAFLVTTEDQRIPHHGLFMTLIGLPEGITEITDDNWYDTNISWLGTKWDIFPPINVDYSEGFLFMTFDTAWTPPSNFCKELAKQYDVTVQIVYMEQGNDFCGREVYDINGTVEEEEYSYMEGLYHLKEDDFEYEFEIGLDFYGEEGDMDDSELEEENEEEVSDEEIREVLMQKYDYISESMADKLLDMIKERNMGKQYIVDNFE